MARQTGVNMEMVRLRNRSAILKYINDHGPTCRKELAQAIGLTPAAVTQICNDLLDEGMVSETGRNTTTKGAGRKQIFLDINYHSAYLFAVNIEPEKTVVALCDLAGEALAVQEMETKKQIPAKDFLGEIMDVFSEMSATYQKRSKKIVAISVGISGLVDIEQGLSKRAYGIWKEEVPVRAIMQERFALPVYIQNNVNAFATAELIYGKGKTHENLMVIKWGPGVGCAMVIDQKIYEGSHSKAAELGHFIVEKNGELCSCGKRGCLETKVSYQALNRICNFKENEFDAAYEKSKGTEKQQELDRAIDLFARSIVNSATIVAPDRIVVAGSLFQNEGIRKQLMKACYEYDERWDENHITYSELAEKEGYIGPVAACVQEILFQ